MLIRGSLQGNCLRSCLPASVANASSRVRVRPFSSSMATASKLRIGYVPEHFSAPLHFAVSRFGLAEKADLTSFPSGTGTMIEALKADKIDVGIGLTEAWVAGIAKDRAATSSPETTPWQTFHVDGTYVESPLRWALSTGANRAEISSVADLRGKKVGVSRLGSGSHIMSTVLADTHGWLDSKPGAKPPFEVVVCGPFADLRAAVRDGTADFFMWEHFTTKKFWDSGELKRIGEIATPWNGWHVVCRGASPDPRVAFDLYPALAKGVAMFREDREGTIDWICANMEYSREDAAQWYSEVKYPQAFGRINEVGVDKAVDSLKKAGVITESSFAREDTLAASGRRVV